MDVIEHPPIFRLPGIPDHVTYTWLVMIILAGLAFVASRNVALVPRGVQNFMEVVLEQFLQMIDDVIGPRGAALPAAHRHARAVHPGRATCWAWCPA